MIERKTIGDKSGSIRKTYNPLISFFSTFIFVLVLFAIYEYSPIGKDSILLSDLKTQYAPALVAYKNQLMAGESLSYSFLIGLGKNTFGMFAYYLSSPLNFLSFLFPAGKIDQAVVLLILLKLSLAASFMTLFLEKRFAEKRRISAIFGAMYAFSSYTIIFMINIMWLDGFLLLPLLLFIIERFIENRRRWPQLVIVLFVLFVSGYYISYMVGIFSFLYLVGRLWGSHGFDANEKRATFLLLGRFISSTFLAIGLSAAVLVPAALDTLRNPDFFRGASTVPVNFTLLSFLDQFFAGTFDSLSLNKPFIYSGLATTLLCLLFFQNPEITRRTKRFAATALIFFVVSFHFSALDRMWHFFDTPNWFKHRYSFLFVFLMITIAYQSFLHIKALKGKAFLRAGAIFLAALIIVQSLGDMRTEGERFYVNLFLGGLLLLLLYASSSPKWPEVISGLRKLSVPMLIMVIMVDILLVNPMYLRPKAFGGAFKSADLTYVMDEAEGLVEYAQNQEKQIGNSFYRVEINDDLYNEVSAFNGAYFLNYHSISSFLSCADKQTNRFLKQFGYGTNFNYFTSIHSYSAIVPDSIMGIKYVLSQEDQCAGYSTVSESTDGTVRLFGNAEALPVLFPVKSDAGSFDYYRLEKDPQNKDLFAFQDDLLVSLFDSASKDKPVYHAAQASGPEVFNAILKQKPLAPKAEEDKVIDEDTLGLETSEAAENDVNTYLRLNKDDSISLAYEVVIQSADPLYLAVPAVTVNSEAKIYVDGDLVGGLSSSTFSQINFLGIFEPGKTIEVTIVVAKELTEFSFLDADFYYCNTLRFAEVIDESGARESVRNLTVTDGHVEATVSVSDDRLLLTTISYEDGWTLWVDGVKTEIVPYQDAMISVPVTKGSHQIELQFSAPGLIPGIVITAVSLICFLGLALFTINSGRKKR